MVPILNRHLKLHPTLMREQYRHLFNSIRLSSNTNTLVDAVDVDAQTAQQMTIEKIYCRTPDATLQAEYAGRPLPDGIPGLQIYLQMYCSQFQDIEELDNASRDGSFRTTLSVR